MHFAPGISRPPSKCSLEHITLPRRKGAPLAPAPAAEQLKRLLAHFADMVDAPYAETFEQAGNSSVLIGLRQSLKQVCFRNFQLHTPSGTHLHVPKLVFVLLLIVGVTDIVSYIYALMEP